MKPRALILSQAIHPIPPLTGAAVEQWIDEVAHRLQNFEAHIISPVHPNRPDAEFDGIVAYQRIRMGNLYKRLFQKWTRLDPHSYLDRVITYAKKINPAIIHLHNAPYFVDNLKKQLPNIPLVLHMHNEKEVCFTREIDCLTGCSDYITQWFKEKSAPSKSFEVLANGVNTKKFFPQTKAQQTVTRTYFKIPNNRFMVLFAGRISPEKGLDVLLDAFAHFPKNKFHLVIAGAWAKGDAQKNERVAYGLKMKEKIEGLKENVTVLGGFSPEEMPAIYQLGDLLMIPSRFEEPFSMVAIEAMASGIPVLALKRGGMVEYMKDHENAYLLDPSIRDETLAKAILEISTTPEKNCQIAAEARKMVEARFTWEAVSLATETLYQKVIKND